MQIADILIDEGLTMMEAMALLDATAKKVLFVHKEGVLLAALTDGDIRRWILSKGNLDAKVCEIANYNPISLHIKQRNTADEIMKRRQIEAIPLVDDANRIVSIAFLADKDLLPSNKLEIPVVIMAGGIGSRLYPYTKILPKPLIPIGEIPILEHIINRFLKYGCNLYYLIINHKKNMIKAYFNEIERDYQVVYVEEEQPLGTGGGLSLLKDDIGETFILSNCDILIEEDYEKIYQYHKNEHNLITMVCSLKKIKIPYGVIEINETGAIATMKEKPELSFFTNTGMYIVEPGVIKEMEFNQAVSFPDIIEYYKQAGERIGIYPISENSWLDMGQMDELEEMKRRLEHD